MQSSVTKRTARVPGRQHGRPRHAKESKTVQCDASPSFGPLKAQALLGPQGDAAPGLGLMLQAVHQAVARQAARVQGMTRCQRTNSCSATRKAGKRGLAMGCPLKTCCGGATTVLFCLHLRGDAGTMLCGAMQRLVLLAPSLFALRAAVRLAQILLGRAAQWLLTWWMPIRAVHHVARLCTTRLARCGVLEHRALHAVSALHPAQFSANLARGMIKRAIDAGRAAWAQVLCGWLR